MASLSIRQATPADIPRLIQVSLEANIPAVSQQFLFPHMEKYREDYDDLYEYEIKADFYDPDIIFMLAEVTDADGGGPQIVGLAVYKWLDQSPWYKRLLRLLGLVRGLTRPEILPAWSLIQYIKHRYWLHLYDRADATNRAQDRDHQQAMHDAEEHDLGVYDCKLQPQVWYLYQLAVHPAFQGKRVGQKLVRWGIEQARREGRVLLLRSVPGTARFYERAGMTKYEYSGVGDLTWTHMFWKPPGEGGEEAGERTRLLA